MPIRILPSEVAARIAAGEVVERPASVVKELVENALDAGATQVTVQIEGGGLELIRVLDNGRGIPAGETPLLFQRHATSKLATEGDLWSIATLGFRGEALYSIAAVAEVALLTRSPDAEVGTWIEGRVGRVTRGEPRGAPPGTAITVHGLFKDLPARLKFLRSPLAEASRVQSVVGQYALAFPGVRFQLSVDGRSSFLSPGGGDLREVAAALYGVEVAQALLEVQGAALSPRVQGLVSPPEVSRANRSHIFLFVNQRPVRNRTLSYALEEAYRGLLPNGRHPLAFLCLSVAPEEVDVNVHPTKAEVRFRREHQVFSAVQKAVRETLVHHSPIPQFTFGSEAAQETTTKAGRRSPAFRPGTQQRRALRGAEASSSTPLAVLPVLRVLGQVQETYLVAEGPDGLYLIDQHAAHERVLYEQVLDAAARGTPEVQGLLEPVSVELSPQQRSLLQAQGEILVRYGWQVEPFGEEASLVRAMPAVLKGKAPAQALVDLLDDVLLERTLEEGGERLAASIACHGAVRAGGVLSLQEMQELAQRLERAREPHTCPHGRPTMIHLSTGHLAHQFHRA